MDCTKKRVTKGMDQLAIVLKSRTATCALNPRKVNMRNMKVVSTVVSMVGNTVGSMRKHEDDRHRSLRIPVVEKSMY